MTTMTMFLVLVVFSFGLFTVTIYTVFFFTYNQLSVTNAFKSCVKNISRRYSRYPAMIPFRYGLSDITNPLIAL